MSERMATTEGALRAAEGSAAHDADQIVFDPLRAFEIFVLEPEHEAE